MAYVGRDLFRRRPGYGARRRGRRVTRRGLRLLFAVAAGLLVTATQIGYAVGILFLVPLGDILDRRRLVPVLVGRRHALVPVDPLAR